MEKSLLDHAFDFISGQKEPTPFEKIWEYVVSAAGLSEEEAKSRVSRFYIWFGALTPIKYKAFLITCLLALQSAKRDPETSKLSLSITLHSV